MSQCAAAEEVAAERFIVVIVEWIRKIGPGGDVSRQLVTAVEIEDTVARNLSNIDPRKPLERIHPAVPQGAGKLTLRVRRPGAELMDRRVGQQRILGYVADVRMEPGVRALDRPAVW